MQYQPDFTRHHQDAEQHVRELQQSEEGQRYFSDDPRYKRRTGRSVLSAPLVLGLVVLLLLVISIAGYLLVNR